MDSIKMKDEVYGNFIIKESLLLDLLKTTTVNRLKNIHQAGATYLVRKGRDGNRFEHSVGVMLLIRKLGGSVEEQAAGLLHDISHTAFSHVIDQVFSNTKETFHEEYKDWFLNHSDVPIVLEKHGLSLDYIFDESNWGILEQPQPDLCSDRIDYTLRDLLNIGIITKSQIEPFVESLKIRDNKIVVSDLSSAIWFVHQYHIEVTELFMNPVEIFANNLLASIIREAINMGILTISDMLLKDDYQILEQLYSTNISRIVKMLNTLNQGILVEYDPVEFDYQGFSKPRIIDPFIIQSDNSLARCSDLVPEVRELHMEVKEKASKGIFVKLISK